MLIVLETKQRKIEINELPKQIPDFASTFESKDVVIKKWIINWIDSLFKSKKIKNNDLLPNKAQLSNYLGVSIGTVQNAIRYVEDEGYLTSKQKVGTMVSVQNSTNPISPVRKLTTKREKIIDSIQAIILQRHIKIGNPVPSTRKMADDLGVSTNTVRLAYEYLCNIGILSSRQTRGNDSNWILKSVPENISVNDYQILTNIQTDTLVEKIKDDLKDYLKSNYTVGDKISSHEELAAKFNVSIKTMHDAISALVEEGILFTRRGQYGTTLIKIPGSNVLQPKIENSIFAKAEEAMQYSYQKIENQIKNIIISDYKVGDKLPAMEELSEMLDVSSNTIRKALQNLAKQGYLNFIRGRYGGTFVTDIPVNDDNPAYKWLAVNPKFND